MPQPLDPILFDRYLAGECSPEEESRVRVWIAEDPARRNVGAIQFPRHGDATDSAWEKMVRRMDGRAGAKMMRSDHVRVNVRWREKRGSGTPTMRRSIQTAWYTLAGLLVAVASWQLNIADTFRRFARAESTYTTYATTNGERATITLADGNTVVLNVASRLEVPTDYGSGNHVLRLPVGEALFTVAHHAGKPFTIVAGPATVRVLGTSFVVRHYGTDTTVLVAVNEGKVSVDSVVVTAQRLIEVGQSGVLSMGRAHASQFMFATGILSFDGTPLSEAIAELNRWYNADIRLDDPSLATRRLKGKFAAGSLTDLASILELTFNVRVVRDGRILHLYPSR